VSDQVLGQFAASFAARVQATPAQAPAAEERPLNALALIWAVVKGWFRSLSGRA
jgi:hypothetical protein